MLWDAYLLLFITLCKLYNAFLNSNSQFLLDAVKDFHDMLGVNINWKKNTINGRLIVHIFDELQQYYIFPKLKQ